MGNIKFTTIPRDDSDIQNNLINRIQSFHQLDSRNVQKHAEFLSLRES